uniref:MBG domain-containing protein n=1 Tax=Aquiflexum sp. TaxID=1872584 RepID=UPI003593F311
MKKLFTFNLIPQVLGSLQLISFRKFPDLSKFLKLYFLILTFFCTSVHAQVISTSTSSTVVIAGGEDFVVNAGVTLSNTNSVATAGSSSTSIVLPNFTNNGSMVGSSTNGAIMSAFNSSVKTNFINNGTMSGKGGINFYSPITLTNNASRSISGTDRAIHFHSGSSGTDLVNNGSIQGNYSSIRIYSGATINSLTNNSTGRIGGTNCNNILGIEHGGTITTLINYGTIRNCRSDLAAINGSSATITTLKNYGVINNNNSTRSISGTAVTNLYNSQSNFNFNGNLPTNYFVYIDGSKTGKITFTNPGTSTLNFAIDPASTLPYGTYTAVLSGINASNIISGTSGVFGEKIWTLTNPTGTQWDLIVSAPATTMSINGGDNQSTTAGSEVSIVPSVLVTDANSNPVSGVSVTFTVASGGGSITGGTATSDASGIATVGSWTLGSTAGMNTLTASSTGLTGSPLTFTSTGVGAATQLAFLAQPQNAVIGSSTGVITVEILDANGNRVTNNTTSVNLSIANNAGSGTLSGTATVNADTGLATFSGLSINKVGEGYTLSATSTGLTSAISSVFDITMKELTISDPILTKTKAYDGTTSAAVTAGALNGVSLGDDITMTAVASYDNANVGTGKAVTVVYTLGGSDANPQTAVLNNLSPGGGAESNDKTYANISRWAQQFTADESGPISNIKLNLYLRNGQSGAFNLELWSGSGTTPTSSLALLKTLDWSSLTVNNTTTNTDSFIEVTSLDNTYSLVSGTQYWLVVSQASNGPQAKRWTVTGSGQQTASYNAKQGLWTNQGTAANMGCQISVSRPVNYKAPATYVVNDGEITTKALTITVTPNQSKVYGEADPSFTFTATGFEGGDDESILTGALARAPGENVGNYSINQGTLSAGDNYSINFTGAGFAITEKTLNITVNSGQSKVYGETDPSFTYTLTAGELVGEDAFTGTLARVTGENVGNYVINRGSLTAGDNYTISFTGADFAITKATMTVTANENHSKVYGQADPTYTYLATGYANEDTESVLSGALTRDEGENVGNYAINQGNLTAGDNYTISFTGADFAITQATLTVAAEDKSKVYGQANPTLTFTYEGLVNGDSKVSTEPSIATTATASSNVGNYPITLAGGSDANYNITLVNGTLTVDQKAVTITAENKSKTYGEAIPTLSFTYTGLVNGDEKVATEPSIATTVTASSNVGTYPITLTGGVDANYDITLIAGELKVTQAALTITAEDKSKVYGEANPALTFNYTGLVNGDTQAAIEPGIATTAT